MSAFIISLVCGVGVAAFVWSRLAMRTGNAQPANALSGGAIAGAVAFIVVLTFTKLILSM